MRLQSHSILFSISRRAAALTLLTLPAMSILQPAQAAEPLTVQVVQKGKPEQGIKSEIRIVDPAGNTNGEFLTDGAGLALVTVPSCDQNAKIVADPILFIFQETTRPCTGDPTVIEVAAMQQARAIENLNKVKSHVEFLLTETNDPAFQKILNEWDALNDALAQNNYSRAAFHSANAAYLLRQKDRGLAENVGFAAMYFGYRSLGVDPAATDQPMLQFDIDQNQYVMTGPGAEMLRRYQAQVGIPVDGIWDGDDFGNLRNWRPPAAANSVPVIDPGTTAARIETEDDDPQRDTDPQPGGGSNSFGGGILVPRDVNVGTFAAGAGRPNLDGLLGRDPTPATIGPELTSPKNQKIPTGTPPRDDVIRPQDPPK